MSIPNMKFRIASRQVITFFSIVVPTLVSSPSAFSAGFQIPNQSLRAIGIAGANVAYTPGPDSAYYNPANMSFLEDRWMVETSLTTLYLPKVDYTDYRSSSLDGSSDSELFYLPQAHISSKNYNNFRFGFSLTYPYGLAKDWDQPYPAATADRFSLTVVEANPTVAYAFSEQFSLAAGLRIVYAKGKVKNGVTDPPFGAISPLTELKRDIDAQDWQLGYNLAATVRPLPEWRLAATYRSKVDLKLDGDATLTALAGPYPYADYDGNSNLPITLPAVFSLATSYSFKDLTLEFTWNRTFWSDIKKLDFHYDDSLNPIFAGFDQPVVKDWKDTDAFRFGLTYQLTEQFTTTLGFAIDNTPVPEKTLGFELPDADAFMYGLGVQYKKSDNLSMGISYMYYHTRSREVSNPSVAGLPGIDGKFTDGGAHAVTVGLITSF